MKYILQVISVLVISMLSGQLSAEISKDYFELLKLPEQCKGGVAGSGVRKEFEMLLIFVSLRIPSSFQIGVKQHGGSIEIDTQQGEFTEFTIVLPRGAATIAKSGERP
jgi:hypothetical protein